MSDVNQQLPFSIYFQLIFGLCYIRKNFIFAFDCVFVLNNVKFSDKESHNDSESFLEKD